MTKIYLRPLALAAAAGALALSAPLSAQEPDTAAVGEVAAADTEAKDEKLICRTEKVIGSRAKRRTTCLTKRQWERVATKGNAFARSLVSNSASGMWDNAPEQGTGD